MGIVGNRFSSTGDVVNTVLACRAKEIRGKAWTAKARMGKASCTKEGAGEHIAPLPPKKIEAQKREVQMELLKSK
jgi:hypothetical protein